MNGPVPGPTSRIRLEPSMRAMVLVIVFARIGDDGHTEAGQAGAHQGHRGPVEELPTADPDGVGIGRVTSGTYGYSVGMSLALAYVKGVAAGDMVDVMVLGKPHTATVLAEPPFDPAGVRLRA